MNNVVNAQISGYSAHFSQLNQCPGLIATATICPLGRWSVLYSVLKMFDFILASLLPFSISEAEALKRSLSLSESMYQHACRS